MILKAAVAFLLVFNIVYSGQMRVDTLVSKNCIRLTNPVQKTGQFDSILCFDGTNIQFSALDTFAKYLPEYDRTVGAITESGSIIQHGDGTVSIDSCTVNLRDNPNNDGWIRRYHIDAAGPFSLTDGALQFISVCYNSGNPQVIITTYPNAGNGSDTTNLWAVIRDGNYVHSMSMDKPGKGLANKLNRMLQFTDPYRLTYGDNTSLLCSETSTPNNRTIVVTAGIIWAMNFPQTIYALNSSTDSLTFMYHSSGVWTKSRVLRYDSLRYDDGTNLVIANNNKWLKYWHYRTIGDVIECITICGNQEYDKESDADTASEPSDRPDVARWHSVLVGSSVIEKGAATGKTIALIGCRSKTSGGSVTPDSVRASHIADSSKKLIAHNHNDLYYTETELTNGSTTLNLNDITADSLGIRIIKINGLSVSTSVDTFMMIADGIPVKVHKSNIRNIINSATPQQIQDTIFKYVVYDGTFGNGAAVFTGPHQLTSVQAVDSAKKAGTLNGRTAINIDTTGDGAVAASISSKEPAITGSTVDKVWTGIKTWVTLNVAAVAGLADSLAAKINGSLTANKGVYATGTKTLSAAPFTVSGNDVVFDDSIYTIGNAKINGGNLFINGSIANGPINFMSTDKNEWFNLSHNTGYGSCDFFCIGNGTNYVTTHATVKATRIATGDGLIKFIVSKSNLGIGTSCLFTDSVVINSNGKVTCSGDISADSLGIRILKINGLSVSTSVDTFMMIAAGTPIKVYKSNVRNIINSATPQQIQDTTFKYVTAGAVLSSGSAVFTSQHQLAAVSRVDSAKGADLLDGRHANQIDTAGHGAINASIATKEPAITGSTVDKVWTGIKTWITLNVAAVAGLADSLAAKINGTLTATYLPIATGSKSVGNSKMQDSASVKYVLSNRNFALSRTTTDAEMFYNTSTSHYSLFADYGTDAFGLYDYTLSKRVWMANGGKIGFGVSDPDSGVEIATSLHVGTNAKIDGNAECLKRMILDTLIQPSTSEVLRIGRGSIGSYGPLVINQGSGASMWLGNGTTGSDRIYINNYMEFFSKKWRMLEGTSRVWSFQANYTGAVTDDIELTANGLGSGVKIRHDNYFEVTSACTLDAVNVNHLGRTTSIPCTLKTNTGVTLIAGTAQLLVVGNSVTVQIPSMISTSGLNYPVVLLFKQGDLPQCKSSGLVLPAPVQKNGVIDGGGMLYRNGDTDRGWTIYDRDANYVVVNSGGSGVFCTSMHYISNKF